MAEPANRKTNTAGGKYYEHPVTGEKFDSVTTILDLIDKGKLKQWAANLSTDFLLDNIGAVLNAQIEPPCGNTNNRCHLKHGRAETCERCPCGTCGDCWRRRAAQRHAFESNRRAGEGTEVHEAINFWVLNGGQRVSLTDAADPYFETFIQWVLDFGLAARTGNDPGSWEQTEVTLLNREHMYAGTSDGALWLRRGRGLAQDIVEAILDRLGKDEALVRVDYKTREKLEQRLFMDMPLQGIAYEMCDVAMLPDGTEHPAPKTDARFVLQLRPDSYTFAPMITTGSFEAFLGVLKAYRWIEANRLPEKHPIAFDLATVLPFPCKHPDEARSTLQTGAIVCTRCQTELVPPPVPGDRSRAQQEGMTALATGQPVETVNLLDGFDDPWGDILVAGAEDPAGIDYAAVQEAAAEAEAEEVIYSNGKSADSQTAVEMIRVPLPPVPTRAIVPTDDEPKKPAKRAPRKTTKKTAPPAVELGSSATLDSLRTFDPGKPAISALAEEIPY